MRTCRAAGVRAHPGDPEIAVLRGNLSPTRVAPCFATSSRALGSASCIVTATATGLVRVAMSLLPAKSASRSGSPAVMISLDVMSIPKTMASSTTRG
jgi:hypothetical protein